VLGGVWKTTSAGATWYPIFDSIKEVSSIGSVEAAPSDANVVYVGTGATGDGNGIYKSTDAGRTWQHLPGLEDSRQIPAMLVDPHDPNLVMAAVLGNARAASDKRGVFRSTDGGRTWTKTLYVDETTGVQNIAWAADRPRVMLATTIRRGGARRELPERVSRRRRRTEQNSSSPSMKASRGRKSPAAACHSSPAA
jgi:photosystem II stability/assembly factor-like uncharacterized protein